VAVAPLSPALPPEALFQIQGNIAGFNKDHQRFVYLLFADRHSGRAFLADIVGDIATCQEVRDFNELFKQVNARRDGAERGTVESTWLNIALSAAGLDALGAPEAQNLAAEFQQGMTARAATIGDIEENEPTKWVAPFQEPLHAVAIIASDTLAGVEHEHAHLREHLQLHGVTELASEDGHVRPGSESGHEHFGFKDGISQPGIQGLTAEPAPPGQDVLAAGEFILGYQTQAEATAPSPPQPGQPGYPPVPAPTPPPLPAWAKDGSYLVIRRLRQNVAAFEPFLSAEAQRLGLSTDVLAAKLVGRYRSGAPLELTPDEPQSAFDPTAQDPSADDPSLLTETKINNFSYQAQDSDGHLVPRAAHIRKTNPRDEPPPLRAGSDNHRILRRGIAFGDELAPDEPPYQPGAEVPPERDRGLIFACYQSSIERQFEFVQEKWANAPSFPQQGDGNDPIISQNDTTGEFNLPPHGNLKLARWVTTTGGGYFFSPSIAALGQLSAR
jgi:Dyp-type peroxidase family